MKTHYTHYVTASPRNSTFSDEGIPILSPAEKCFALADHMFPGSEDGEGHCWDILNRILDDDIPDDWVQCLRDKYGKPTPIAL